MTTPLWCLLVVVFLPYASAFTAGYFRGKQFGTADNKNPRAQAAQLEGTGARIYAAQANAWEAVAMFTAAVTVAHLAGADPDRSATAALVFLAARLAHFAFYLADLDKLRTLVFLIGWVCCLWLFGLAISA